MSDSSKQKPTALMQDQYFTLQININPQLNTSHVYSAWMNEYEWVDKPGRVRGVFLQVDPIQ